MEKMGRERERPLIPGREGGHMDHGYRKLSLQRLEAWESVIRNLIESNEEMNGSNYNV